MLLERLGRRTEAIDALEAAAALAPDAPLPAKLLGGVLSRSSRLREAEAALRRASRTGSRQSAAAQRPRHGADAHAPPRRGARAAAGAGGAARRATRRCCATCANATVCLGLQEEAVALARRAIALAPGCGAAAPRAVQHAALPPRTSPAPRCWPRCTRLCRRGCRAPISAASPTTRDPERRLTIGLLSGSLKTHPVGWLTIAGFETLDPRAFDDRLPGAERGAARSDRAALPQRRARMGGDRHAGRRGAGDARARARHRRADRPRRLRRRRRACRPARIGWRRCR